MIAVLLLQFVAGIGLTQAVSDPRQVTLRWLRLGGLIALALMAVCVTTMAMSPVVVYASHDVALVHTWDFAIIFSIPAQIQLVTVQRGMRRSQRIAAAINVVTSSFASAFLLQSAIFTAQSRPSDIAALYSALQCWPTTLFAAGLLGGFLMTMLLGHAYLTAGGEMTQKPFVRLVRVLGALLVLRTIGSVAFGLWPWLALDPALVGGNPFDRTWDVMMITARYLVGLVVPGVFTYMIYDCVQRRANQSATGILYVAGVLIIVGEGAALALIRSTGLIF